jgi:hypothetical protein
MALPKTTHALDSLHRRLYLRKYIQEQREIGKEIFFRGKYY